MCIRDSRKNNFRKYEVCLFYLYKLYRLCKKAFNLLKGLTYDTFVRNRIDRAIEKIDKSLEYENKGMPYSALLEIKKVFSEV